jgi:MraZ protein
MWEKMGESGEKWEIFIYFYKFNPFFMTNFIGDHICKVDTKGRIVLPATFKRQMSLPVQDRFVVKKDIFEQCLVLYPMDEWERQNNLIRSKINPYNKEHNKFIRNFFRGTAELILDNNNRMLIPKRLMESVGIQKEVVLDGQSGKIEIWAKHIYETIAENEDEFALLAEKIMGGSIEEKDE